MMRGMNLMAATAPRARSWSTGRVPFRLLALGLALTLWTGAQGQEKKEVTIKGQIICAKCGLAKETKCMTTIVEKKDGKDVIY